MHTHSNRHHAACLRGKWPRDSAAYKLTAKVPTAHPSQTAAHVLGEITKDISQFDTIDYIYVVDEEWHLTGVLSIGELYRADPQAAIGRVCRRRDLVMVKPETDQERVVYIALKHNIKAVPVVNRDHCFLGAIPSDTILHILFRETHEDILRLGGVYNHSRNPFDNILTLPLGQSVRHRLPWLLLGLLGGLLAAHIIGLFEATLRHNLILAAFIPLIVYMGDAVGTQMEAFMIRDLAFDRSLPFMRYLLRQMVIISVIGVLSSAALFCAAFLLYGDVRVSGVLGLSLFIAICSSVLTGVVTPYLFHKMKFDPANASGPVATIIQDLLSIIIYFGLATVLL